MQSHESMLAYACTGSWSDARLKEYAGPGGQTPLQTDLCSVQAHPCVPRRQLPGNADLLKVIMSLRGETLRQQLCWQACQACQLVISRAQAAAVSHVISFEAHQRNLGACTRSSARSEATLEGHRSA